MISLTRNSRLVFWLAPVTVLVLAMAWVTPASARQAGTSLTAELTATGHSKQAFGWDIAQSVSPDRLDLLPGATGVSQVTIAVNKAVASRQDYVDGQICVTNSGDLPTEGLQIRVAVQVKIGSGHFQDAATAAVDLSAQPALAPGESYCYPYSVAFTPVAGAAYRSAAQITITNHAGWIPGRKHRSDPTACSFGPNPKADFDLPGGSDQAENATITVSDTNGGSWLFGDSGSVTYDRIFACPDDQGKHDNVATILETGQSASASVQVNCLVPDPGKD